MCKNDKPAVKEFHRIGTVKSEACRPVKIFFATEEALATILSRSRGLWLTSELESVYLGPDRSTEESESRRQLVAELKEEMRGENLPWHQASPPKPLYGRFKKNRKQNNWREPADSLAVENGEVPDVLWA